uniref:Small ribosomal subunit protein uS14c n=1 Tax=Pseudobryopsis hainanensis TaxID=2320808 RepID=A0A3S5X007_9CHLO|nr:ribosomal protein S14 [Pseudobryopsis hainanensis]
MARKSLVERQRKRQQLIHRYKDRYNRIRQTVRRGAHLVERFQAHQKLQLLPRNCLPVRSRNRCSISGRPRGFFRDFGLSRHFLRNWAHEGFLPGVKKASW